MALLVLVLAACASGEEGEGGEEAGAAERAEAPPDEPAGTPADEESASAGDDPEALGEIAVEREIHPDEWERTIVACIQAEGFPAELGRHGGVSLEEVPDEQATQAASVMDACIERFPVQAAFRGRLDDDARMRLYRWYVEQAVPCLREEGHAIDEVPSEDAFLSAYGTDDHWTPFLHSDLRLGHTIDLDDWYDLLDRCPQNPSADYLMGSDDDSP